jgi:hypothetical protein
MQEITIIFIDNNTLLGEYDEETKVLTKVRSLVSMMDKGKNIIGLQELIGYPSSVEIKNPTLVYKTSNRDIIDLYIQSTTKLTLAKAIH